MATMFVLFDFHQISDYSKPMSIKDNEAQLLQIFEQFTDWENKYKYIIQLGKDLPPLPEVQRIEDNKIKGCQSQVWLWVELSPQSTLQLYADSDALITKGLVALVVKLYQQQTPFEVFQHDLSFFKKIGLMDHLSPSRANGLANMLKQLKNYALAYHLKCSN